jgi:hypothetical protein
MKRGKIIVYISFIFLTGFFLVPIFLNNHAKYHETIDIFTDPVSIYRQISDLSHWDDWLPVSNNEMNERLVIDSSGIIAYLSFSKGGLNISGKIEITAEIPYQSVFFYVNIKHFETFNGSFLIEPKVNYSTLHLNGEINDLKYPVGKWKGLFFPFVFSKSFKKSLKNINNVVMK